MMVLYRMKHAQVFQVIFNDYIQAGNNADANGNFIPYLLEYVDVYGYVFDEYRYDIETLESYEAVQEIFNRE